MRTLVPSPARIFFAVCLAAAGYFTYTAVDGYFEGERLRDEQAAASQSLAELQWKKSYLEAVKSYVASDAFVEQEARRRLGFIRPGETPFVVESPPVADSDESASEWWQRLFPR